MIIKNNTSRFDYDKEPFLSSQDMGNKLFCTFSTQQDLEQVLGDIKSNYNILYNKIFILYSEQQDEYLLTYNVDLVNVSNFLENTILVHRKKETNTLYTINALNCLITELNNGILDTSYRINWKDYRNSIILTKGPELKRLDTKLFRIIEID